MKPMASIKLSFMAACVLATTGFWHGTTIRFESDQISSDMEEMWAIYHDQVKSHNKRKTHTLSMHSVRGIRPGTLPQQPIVPPADRSALPNKPASIANLPADQQPPPSESNRQKRPVKVLEFVHIPNTEGTTIEAAYANAQGGAWGYCKFQNAADSYVGSHGAVKCPIQGETQWSTPKVILLVGGWKIYQQLVQGTPIWHVPSHRWDDAIAFNTTSTRLRIYPPNIPRFCVVRHPYERLISEYYFVHATRLGTSVVDPSNQSILSAEHMNEWAQRMLAERRIFAYSSGLGNNSSTNDPWRWFPKHYYGAHGGHWIGQYDYVYDHTGRQRVDHVLKFENITAEFDDLMTRYALTNMTLLARPLHQVLTTEENNNQRVNKTRLPSTTIPKLTRQDLTKQTKAMIHFVFHRDFDSFGYNHDVILTNTTRTNS
jgi:Sulfotransferase family